MIVDLQAIPTPVLFQRKAGAIPVLTFDATALFWTYPTDPLFWHVQRRPFPGTGPWIDNATIAGTERTFVFDSSDAFWRVAGFNATEQITLWSNSIFRH